MVLDDDQFIQANEFESGLSVLGQLQKQQEYSLEDLEKGK